MIEIEKETYTRWYILPYVDGAPPGKWQDPGRGFGKCGA